MGDHADQTLSSAAQLAWLAYQAMGDSKKMYFNFLQELDRKYHKGQSPSIAENLKLESLLASHDEKVRAFTGAMAAVTVAADRKKLLAKLSDASAIFGGH